MQSLSGQTYFEKINDMTSESIVMETEIPYPDEHENAGKPLNHFSVEHHITTMSGRSDYKKKETGCYFSIQLAQLDRAFAF